MASNKKFDVVVVGNAGVDTNVYLPGRDIDFSVEANYTENLDYVGHAGAYSSRGFAQLGKRTAFIGAIGDDHNGRFVREELSGDGIDLSAVFTDPAGTTRSVNFMYADGRRRNFFDGKSHMRLTPDLDACRSVLAQTRLVHFSIPNWARYLLPMAKELGLTIACDLQDVVAIDDPYRRDFVEYADILFFSAVNHPDPRPAIQTFLGRHPNKIIVVGMGARGSALGTRQGIRFFDAVEMDLPVMDTNGAGDGLAVGFLSSYVLESYSLEESIRRGQIAARYTCAQKASSSNLITREKLELYFKQGRD